MSKYVAAKIMTFSRITKHLLENLHKEVFKLVICHFRAKYFAIARIIIIFAA